MKEVIDNVLIIKIGTNTLVKKHTDGSEKLDIESFERIGEQIQALQADGQNVVIVSSAAITAGMVATGLNSRPMKGTEMPELQRLASIGWRHILNAWDSALDGLTIGELLLTQRELGLSSEREEALLVTQTLLKHGNIAIANENDAISHKEIAFGDNDMLAATFAAQIARSSHFGRNVRLVLLSDVDGVYNDIGDKDSIIGIIENIEEYQHLAKGPSNCNGTGGMVTKFAAAKIAHENGINMWITNGRAESTIKRALNGEIGTHFTIPQI